MVKKELKSTLLIENIVSGIEEVKGQGISIMDLREIENSVCDYFILCTGTSNIHVQSIVNSIKKFVSRSSKSLVFEQNTTDLRNQFVNTVNPFLETVQANSGLNAFRVVMDDTNNTPETIDRNQLIGQIFLQPTKTAEFIILDFVVQPTGAEFPE